MVRSRAARSNAAPVCANTMRAGNDVGVSVQVLGGRVQNQVGAEPDRPAEHGRGHRRVDRQQRAGRMGDARHLGDVGDRPQRVGGRLDPDEPRLPGADGSLQGRGVAGIDEGRLDAVARRVLHQPLPQAPVHGRGRYDVSGTFEREEGGGRRRHAGREHERGLALLQVGQHVLDLPHGGVVRTAVAVASPVLIVGIAHEGGGHVDRRHHGPGRGIDDTSGLRGDRLGLHAGRTARFAVARCRGRLRRSGGASLRLRKGVAVDELAMCRGVAGSGFAWSNGTPVTSYAHARKFGLPTASRYSHHGFVLNGPAPAPR